MSSRTSLIDPGSQKSEGINYIAQSLSFIDMKKTEKWLSLIKLMAPFVNTSRIFYLKSN